MKSFMFILATACAFQAGATSLYYGPWASKTVGSYSCRIKPHAAVIKNKGATQVKKLDLDYGKLSAMITASSNANFITAGIHVKKTDPAIIIEAGMAPDVDPFVVFKDSSRIIRKSGVSSEALIKLVNSVCK